MERKVIIEHFLDHNFPKTKLQIGDIEIKGVNYIKFEQSAGDAPDLIVGFALPIIEVEKRDI